MSLTDIDFLILKKKLDLLEDRLFSLEQEYNRLNYYTEQDIKKSSNYVLEQGTLDDAGSYQVWKRNEGGEK